MIFFLSYSASMAAQPPLEPVRAAFSHDILFYTTPAAASGFHAIALIDLGETKQRIINDLSIDGQDYRSGPHWHIGYGKLWCTCFERYIFRCDLQAYTKGKVVTNPEESFDERSHYLLTIPADQARSLSGLVSFKGEMFNDFVPVASNRVRLVILTNVRGTMRRSSSDQEGLRIILNEPTITKEDKEIPRWSMSVHECARDWDKRRPGWGDYEWKLVEKIVPVFKERFQIVMQGNTYYFITASGKLYRTGARGILTGQRSIEPVWDDASRPITHFITDADANRTFLFCKPAKKDEPGVFFEMGPKPEPKPYDLSKVKPAKAEEPLKSVLERARFLADQKLLKNP